jgi:hypothetical protein
MTPFSATVRQQQAEAACLPDRQANLDAATCLPKLRRRQVAANLMELGYGG